MQISVLLLIKTVHGDLQSVLLLQLIVQAIADFEGAIAGDEVPHQELAAKLLLHLLLILKYLKYGLLTGRLVENSLELVRLELEVARGVLRGRAFD